MANELDLIIVIVQMAYVVFFGGIAAIVFIFKSRIPPLNRPKYKVIIKEMLPDGRKRTIKETNGWQVTSKGIQYFWVQMKGVTAFFKGIKFDRDYMKTIDEFKEICLISTIPDSMESTDYYPENVPLTQKDMFVEDERKNIEEILTKTLTDSSIFIQVRDKDGNERIAINEPKLQEKVEMAGLRTKQNLMKHSRIVDLDSSKWLEDKSDAQTQQKMRSSGNDLLEKMFPYLVLILIGFFAFLSYDSISKNWIASAQKFEEVTNAHTMQIVQACGGKFVASNVTGEAPKQGGSIIPFLNG